MDPQVFLKVVRHHSVPVVSTFGALLTKVHLAWALQIEITEGCAWECQLRDMARDQRSLLQPHQKHRASWGASYSLGGPDGRGTTHDAGSSSFGATDVVEGEQQTTLWGLLQRSGNPLSLHTQRRTQEEGGASLLALWTSAAMRSTSQLTEYPPRPYTAPEVPLTPGMLQLSSFWPSLSMCK